MSDEALRAPIRHPEVLSVGTTVRLAKHHLKALEFREVNVKEAFTLVDAAGTFFRAAFAAADNNGGSAKIYEVMPSSPESPAHITLLCAVLARQRMLGVIQKATELGVMGVMPVLSEKSVPRSGLAHEKAHAWPAQAIRAAKQCRRGSIPEVTLSFPLAEALASSHFTSAGRKYYLDDQAPVGAGLPEVQRTGGRIALVTGPEGGFSDQERKLLAAKGATPLRLGGRVLRAETSVLVGLAMLQHYFGDL